MDRTVFADTEAEPRWWLLQEEIDYLLVDPRKALSVALGNDREAKWYLDKWKLEGLYDTLEAQAPRLLIELDEATDEHKRKEWLEKAIAAVNPATVGGKEDHPTSGSPSSPPAETASPQAPTTAAARAAKPSAFGKRQAEAASPEAASPEAPTPATAAAPPAAKPSAFAKNKVGADTAQIDAAVRRVMDELSSENLPSLATEMGITTEQLKELLGTLPADFKKMVADQVRALS
jgi:hypothetical protein